MGTWLLLALLVTSVRGQDYETLRLRMVRDQIAARDVADPRVLEAMRRVPRHLFVPDAIRHRAYDDTPLPIGMGQTISQPYIVALMSQLLRVAPGHKALEIGTGSGYQAAVLAELGARVYTMEVVRELAESSGALLARLKTPNVTVRFGDGYQGWPEQAPFDRILLTAAPPEVPPALLQQLKPGGVLVAPVGRHLSDQELIVIEKSNDGRLRRRTIIPVRFVPMVPAPK